MILNRGTRCVRVHVLTANAWSDGVFWVGVLCRPLRGLHTPRTNIAYAMEQADFVFLRMNVSVSVPFSRGLSRGATGCRSRYVRRSEARYEEETLISGKI